MPYKKNQFQFYIKITVWFTGGTKTYTISPSKKVEFLKNLRRRNDVIKYTVQNFKVYVY